MWTKKLVLVPQQLIIHLFVFSPVLFSIEKDNLFSADFLLATLSASDSSSQCPTPASTTTATTRTSQSITANRQSTASVLRNQSQSRQSLSRAGLHVNTVDTSQAAATTSTTDAAAESIVENQGCRLDSLSLLEPHPISVPMGTDLECDEVACPPPTKRARARFIFQRCFKSSSSSQSSLLLGEIYAADSDCESPDMKPE